MGNFVVSDSNSDEAFSYARDGSNEAQSPYRSVNNNEVSSSSSSSKSSGSRGTKAQRSQVEAVEVREGGSEAEQSEEESSIVELDYLTLRGLDGETAKRVCLT